MNEALDAVKHDHHGFNEHLKIVKKFYSPNPGSPIKRMAAAISHMLAGISGELTPEQKARIEEMEQDYQELIGKKFKDPMGI